MEHWFAHARTVTDIWPSPRERPCAHVAHGHNGRMIVLAVVLLVLIVVFSVAIAVSNPEVYELSLFRVLVPVTSAGVYFTGLGACLLTLLALWLLRAGLKRRRVERNRLKEAEAPKAVEPASNRPADSSLDLNEREDFPRDEDKK